MYIYIYTHIHMQDARICIYICKHLLSLPLVLRRALGRASRPRRRERSRMGRGGAFCLKVGLTAHSPGLCRPASQVAVSLNHSPKCLTSGSSSGLPKIGLLVFQGFAAQLQSCSGPPQQVVYFLESMVRYAQIVRNPRDGCWRCYKASDLERTLTLRLVRIIKA